MQGYPPNILFFRKGVVFWRKWGRRRRLQAGSGYGLKFLGSAKLRSSGNFAGMDWLWTQPMLTRRPGEAASLLYIRVQKLLGVERNLRTSKFLRKLKISNYIRFLLATDAGTYNRQCRL